MVSQGGLGIQYLVRAAYCAYLEGSSRHSRATAEFDEWLRRVRAEAWDEGHEAGLNDAYEPSPLAAYTENPYW